MTIPTIKTAIFLAEDENSLTLDRSVLRRLGVIQAQFFSSGRLALDYLRTITSASSAVAVNDSVSICAPVDALVCNERLADMTGLRFLSHVRSLPNMAHIPALFLVGNRENATAIIARATNSCAVLARPYSPEQAHEALNFAAKPEVRQAPLVLPPSFAETFSPHTRSQAPRQNTASLAQRDKRQPLINRQSQPKLPLGETSLREGLVAMQRGDNIAAEKLLRSSYETDPGRIETCLALSRLHALLHREKEELMWLCRALTLCLKRGEKVRAESIIARLPCDRHGQESLLEEAGFLLQEGEAKTAALSFLEAHKLAPSRPLHTLISRTCMFTPAPEDRMRELIQALARSGHEATASKLHCRLFQPPKEDEEKTPGFLDNFPLLCDILSIASYTFKTWRHAT